ncbi:hypothetical protein HYH03_015661 [Edaphochlamys debaryana]|uniref:Uncharacterized protein n=1 Tax=Edaphochlamys debaryana TaxID=47281 RepID=A0A835XK57_9CHLO|nr:hypothetical protein HYH03_015661 [Edaphochlamys debaryana]|eukprot:KAG2485598.1 hypothetical protein HYH03_015661 [Edaphochlamys debaryana]
MVDAALFWRKLIHENNVPGLTLPDNATGQKQQVGGPAAGKTAVPNVGLLAHSVGGGLAPYVVDACAKAKPSMPFVSAHVLAPQTALVYRTYKYDGAASGRLLVGVKTKWGVQYGGMDLLSWPETVEALCDWLEDKEVLEGFKFYPLGTHVGFEDQFVVNGQSVVTALRCLPRIWGTVTDPLRLLRRMPQVTEAFMRTGGVTDVRTFSYYVREKQQCSPGKGTVVDVEQPNDEYMYRVYFVLALGVSVAYCGFVSSDWAACLWVVIVEAVKWTILALPLVFTWLYVELFRNEAKCQRPEARQYVVDFFTKTLQ